jgi:hypothetical protein
MQAQFDDSGNQVGVSTTLESDQEAGSDSPREESPRCLHCGGANFYRLADGRLMCKSCRARFAPHKRPGRLDRKTRDNLTSLFWHMVPASRAANRSGLNRKTVQRHYHMLRRGLSALSDSIRLISGIDWRLEGYFYGRLVNAGGRGLQGDFPLFGLARHQGQVLVIMVPGHRDYRGLEAGSVHYVSTAAPQAGGPMDGQELAEAFWEFSRFRLSRYQGGWKANLPLFLHEMAFRFNWRESVVPPEPLMSLV